MWDPTATVPVLLHRATCVAVDSETFSSATILSQNSCHHQRATAEPPFISE